MSEKKKDSKSGDAHEEKIDVEKKNAQKTAEKVNNYLEEMAEEDDDNFQLGTLQRLGGAPAITTTYDEPNADKIKAYVIKKHLRNRETGRKFGVCSTNVGYKICGKERPADPNSGTEAVRRLGPGVTSYFSFLTIYGYAFLLFGIITLPALFFNRVVGGALDGIPTYSVGNLLQVDDLTNAGNLSADYTFEFQGHSVTIPRVSVSYVNVGCDIIVILLFLLLAENSLVFFKKAEYRWEVAHPKIEHFTVEVKNLPKKVSYAEVKNHFARIVVDRVNPNRAKKLSKRSRVRQALEAEATNDVNLQNAVEDVQLVTGTRDKLSLAIKMAALSKEVEKKEALYCIADRKRSQKKISDARFRIIALEYNTALAKLQKVYEEKVQGRNTNDRTIKAFVTFSSVSSRNGVLEEYKRKGILSVCSRTDKELTLQNKKLVVSAANPPGLVKWEHMEYKTFSRIWRSGLSILAIITVLLISAVSMFLVSKVEQLELFSILDDAQVAAIDPDVFSCSSIDQATIIDTPPCNAITSINSDSDLDCVKAFSCFCDIQDPRTLENPVCKQLLLDDLVESAFLMGTAVLVVIFNIVLEVLISWSVTFEKDEDRAREEKKLFLRLFIASYINTALVKLFADISVKDLIGFELPYFTDGEFTDFTSDWYGQVGFDITIIAITNVFGPHIWSFMEYFYVKLRRTCFRPISLDDMERKYLGPSFLLPLRYAQALVTIYFTLTYSSGIPLLYPIAAGSMFVTFWVDKFLLLKLYAKPPLYTNDIVLWICRMMKYAALLHAVFGVTMFSEPTLFPLNSAGTDLLSEASGNIGDLANRTSGFLESQLAQRITSLPVLFLSVIAALLALYLLLSQFDIILNLVTGLIGKIISTILDTIMCIICCGKSEDDKLQKKLTVLEELDAKRRKLRLDRGKMVGIDSYNILANPLYAKRFKLKDNLSFHDLMKNNSQIHSTAEVLRYLDNGANRNQAHVLLMKSEQITGSTRFKDTELTATVPTSTAETDLEKTI